jgi:hypothetical protein
VPIQAIIGCARADWEADSEAMIRMGINIMLFVRGAPQVLPDRPRR